MSPDASGTLTIYCKCRMSLNVGFVNGMFDS